MSLPAALPLTGLRDALDRAGALVRQTNLRKSWFDLGWRWIAAFTAYYLLDLIFGLPVWARWILLVALVALPIYGVAAILAKRRNLQLGAEQAARLVEDGNPELGSTLINAVQFERGLPLASDVQAALMRQEIELADRAALKTSIDRVIDRSGEHRSLRIYLFATAAWIVGMVAFMGVSRAVLPRMFAPWLDDVTPPYSSTKIEIEPQGTSVRYGGSLVVDATITGPIPEAIDLGIRGQNADWQFRPMEGAEPGKYEATLDNLRSDAMIEVKAGSARSRRLKIKVLLPPVVQSLQVSYHYPDYMARKPMTEELGDAGVHGFRGTKVDLQIVSNRDLSGGTLDLSPPTQVPVQVDPKDPKHGVASFEITENGSFHLGLTSPDGQANQDAGSGKIVLERDQSPNVWFNSPAEEIAVTPQTKVTLDVEADDDIGVRRVALHRVVNGIADSESTVFDGQIQKSIDRKVPMDLGDLGLRPGDEIVYYAEAYDNDPGHPNYAKTDTYKMKVVSEDDYKDLLAKQRQVDKLSKEVADIQNALDSLAQKQKDLADRMRDLQQKLSKNPGDASLKKQMADAQQEQKALAETAGKLAKQLEQYAKSPSGSKLEASIKQKVGEAAKRVEAAQQAMKAAAAGDRSKADQAAKTLSNTADSEKKQVGEAIKNVEKIAPLYQDLEKFKALLDRQGQLVLQAREFQDNSPKDEIAQAKMDSIASQQGQIEGELKQLGQDLRQHANEAQKDFPKASQSAVAIADEIARRKIPDLMNSAQDHFTRRQGPGGFSDAQSAFAEMDAMVQKGSAGSGEGKSKGELDIKLQKSLGQSGLGESLSQCLNPGEGQKSGSGTGSSSGGTPTDGKGSPSGGAEEKGMQAYTPNTESLGGGEPSKDAHTSGRLGDNKAQLTPDRVEKLGADHNKPPDASDQASRAYPPEYRKLIKDYFVAVTKEKKP